jgi:hypothetical protein
MNKPVARFFILTSLLTVLFNIVAPAQQPLKNYDREWKKVTELSNKGLPQSALAEVKKIYALAKKEKQEAQVIKSLVFMTNLQEENRENNNLLSIAELEKEIILNQEPAASIINSLIASLYWKYYINHRWQLYGRTQTTDFKKDDIATWGIDDFHKKIGELFLRSIRNEKLLQQTRLQPYDALIDKGNVRHLRPTLYDLLAHRALEYFENNERDIKKPAYAFEISQAAAFDPAADFIHRKFETSDSLSLQHKALLIYQKLIAFHINDTKPDALIDADIKRIEFVRERSVHPDNDQLYFNAINHIAHQYESLPAVAQAWYLVAAYYDEKASGYAPYGDTTHRFDRLKAKAICERIIAQKDSSEGKMNCYNLLRQINNRWVQVTIEKVNLPNQPFRALLNYRNFNRLYLRIIKVDEPLKKNLDNAYDEKYWPAIMSAKSIRDWEQTLPLMTDLQHHNAEIKINALPVGEYILIASPDKNISAGNAVVVARRFHVSSISYVLKDNDFFVLDRDNGQPLAGATVQLWQQKYDSKTSKYVKEKLKLYKTDEKGYLHIEYENDKNRAAFNYYLDIILNNDRLFLDDESNYYYSRNSPASKPMSREEEIEATTYTYFFSDRSIYRPGQTIFFKGISLAYTSGQPYFPRTDYKTPVYLINANGERVDSLNLATNEYGSISGKFQLPQNVLNGQFSLQVKSGRGSIGFRVEEYKRPKFFVEYEPLKGTYKVNDTIKLTGIAKAYAGNNIDGATVRYRVVRQARFPYPWLFSKGWLPPIQAMEIAHGELKTDKDGKFIVVFTAIPDLKLDRKLDPIFTYRVMADITDINGETRSGERSVSVGYKSLLLKVTMDEKVSSDSLKNIFIRTENMNGEFEPANVTVTITKLKEEKRLIRQRLWERPDQFVMSRTEYISYFPYDEYDNETDPKSWEKGQTIFNRSDSVRVNGEWNITGEKIQPGYYVIEISTKDKNGETVKDTRYVEIYDEKSKQLSYPRYLWTEAADEIEPGEKTGVLLGTSADNVFVVQQLNKRPGSNQPAKNSFSIIKLNNEKRFFDLSATEADRGGYGVAYLFVKHNRFYQFNQTVVIPWTNKELKIEYASYRDKTLPGSEEVWKLKLSGYKNEKVAAEMLASMYDASLDQFNPHNWTKPGIWANYYNNLYWNGTQNFIANAGIVKPAQDTGYKQVNKEYDRLFFSLYPEISFQHDMNPDARYYKEGAANAPAPFRGNNYQKVYAEASLSGRADEVTVVGYGIAKKQGLESDQSLDDPAVQMDDNQIQVRKNFNETAFFFPDLRTDSSGAIEFSFTMPEALTRWKFQALAHTKDLSFGYSSKEIVTQKQLMVQPNAPRFLREGDKIEFTAKIVNLTEKELSGQAVLQLTDATTNQPIDGLFKHTVPSMSFKVAAGQSTLVKFPIDVPLSFNNALVWKIVAKSGDVSDGEENAMPVLTNRMLVTETMPLNMRGTGTKDFSFDKLLQSGTSNTLKHQSLTIEYTSNPAWYALQALPYLVDYPYECSEQTWNRYYANALAGMIANSSPRIKQVFEKWKTTDTAALLSNLQKNEELKSVLLAETPWVLQAKTEAEQKRNIALLFDMVKMSGQLNGSYEKLRQTQLDNGGFSWFKGGPDDRYITQYIITGIGHLKKLKAFPAGHNDKLNELLYAALPYLDQKIKADYDQLIKNKTNLKTYTPGSIIIQYLYMRSFFPENKIPAATQTAYNYFRDRAQKTWAQQSKYMQGMLVLALGRTKDATTPAAILKSLKETSINNEELGMYWKDANRGWWWHEAPIERQALLIEAFQEIGKDTKTVDDLKTWLLKNKQTNNWESTKATAEACYALLLQGTKWIDNEPVVQIQSGDLSFTSSTETFETGTGYFKKSIQGSDITPKMGNISVTVGSSKVPLQGDLGGSSSSWGAIYWQYFEDLDKITTASTPLKLDKKLFVETVNDRGPVLTPVKDGDALKIGDKIKVRIELRVDRDMEYVHMKDMRASALEPVNVLSSYKWQGGLGYYETTKDASTNFFFSSLRKGVYVFEYALFITHAGNFSNGVTTIQCMYAPEFTSHSEGIRINVK